MGIRLSARWLLGLKLRGRKMETKLMLMINTGKEPDKENAVAKLHTGLTNILYHILFLLFLPASLTESGNV